MHFLDATLLFILFVSNRIVTLFILHFAGLLLVFFFSKF